MGMGLLPLGNFHFACTRSSPTTTSTHSAALQLFAMPFFFPIHHRAAPTERLLVTTLRDTDQPDMQLLVVTPPTCALRVGLKIRVQVPVQRGFDIFCLTISPLELVQGDYYVFRIINCANT